MSRFGSQRPASGSTRSSWLASRFVLPAVSLAATLSVSACNNVRYNEAFYPEGNVGTVVLRIDEGVVDLVPGHRLRVERAVRAAEGTLTLSHHVDDGVLVIEARCRTFIQCPVDTEVAVPEGVDVQVELGRGEVWATGIATLGIELRDGTADVETTGTLNVQVGSGSVRAQAPRDANLKIAVGDGDIDVQVAPGPWLVDATAARLQVTGVTPDDHATGRLELVAPSGSVTVTGRDRIASR